MSSKYSNYIIALDLDETLLNSKGEVTQKSIDVLNKCKNDGFVIAISSTRGFGSCKKIAGLISADFVCCQAGNMIVDKNQNIIYKNPFKAEDVALIVDTFSKYTDLIFVDSDFNLYGSVLDSFTTKWGTVYCDLNKLKDLNAYKICIGYEESYKQQIIDFCNNKGFICRKMLDANYMLITPSNSNKFYALEQLINILESNKSKLVVFGDDVSDVLSIQNAEFGVAMKNSQPEVLKQAKFVTLSNDEDGVAVFLENQFYKD